MKIAIKISVTLLIIVISLSLSAQLLHKDSINNIVELLSKEERMTLSGDKFDSKNAINLFTKATKDDLIVLTHHSSPIIRVYAIYYLTQFYSNLPFVKLIKEHLNDIETVRLKEWEHDSEGPPTISYPARKVGDLFLKFIGSTHVGRQSLAHSVKYKPYLKNKADLQKIDDILICTPNKLSETENLLCYAPVQKNNYRDVRKLVKEKLNPNAVIYLSKYKKNKDVKLILNNLPELQHSYGEYPYLYFAVFLNFQHPQMFKYLSENLNKFYQFNTYLNAVAAYKDTNALNLLQQAFKQIYTDGLNKDRKHYVMQIIINALSNNFSVIYAPLLFDLLESDARAYPKVKKDLWKINPNTWCSAILFLFKR